MTDKPQPHADGAHAIVQHIITPKEWRDELADRVLPVLAKGMAEAAVAHLLVLGVDIRRKQQKGLKYNPYRDPETGRFTVGGAMAPDTGGSFGGSGGGKRQQIHQAGQRTKKATAKMATQASKLIKGKIRSKVGWDGDPCWEGSTNVRKSLKQALAKRIGKTLDKSVSKEALEAFNEDYKYAGGRVHGGKGKTEGELAVEVSVDLWAQTSGDSKAEAIALQIAAEKELGVRSPWKQTGKKEVKAANRLFEKHEDVMRAYTRATYENTQASLKKVGLQPDDDLLLYRGMTGDNAGIQLGRSGISKKNGKSVNLQAVSSFSTAHYVASNFSYDEDSDMGIVMGTRVKVSDVFSTAVTGSGCLVEGEFLVMGGKRKMDRVIAKEHDREDATDTDFWKGMKGIEVQTKEEDDEDDGVFPEELLPDEEDSNADWPKRTPDRFEDLEGEEDEEKNLHTSAKTTTASEWANENIGDWASLQEAFQDTGTGLGVLSEIPDWMQSAIATNLSDSFNQSYWDKVSQTTMGQAENVLRQGLANGESITTMASQLRNYYQADGFRAARARSENIARTESKNALNGARKESVKELQTELPTVPIIQSWLSVLGNTTRSTHADLDGVPEDENGMWNLGGIDIPWPGHFSLPPEERCQCQCSLTIEFGMDDGEAQRLIGEYWERVEEHQRQLLDVDEEEVVGEQVATEIDENEVQEVVSAIAGIDDLSDIEAELERIQRELDKLKREEERLLQSEEKPTREQLERIRRRRRELGEEFDNVLEDLEESLQGQMGEEGEEEFEEEDDFEED